jgi:hypothetical protein
MWPFPVARVGSEYACFDASYDEGGLRAEFFQNNHLNFHTGSSANAWKSGALPAPTPLTVTCFKPCSELPPIP